MTDAEISENSCCIYFACLGAGMLLLPPCKAAIEVLDHYHLLPTHLLECPFGFNSSCFPGRNPFHSVSSLTGSTPNPCLITSIFLIPMELGSKFFMARTSYRSWNFPGNYDRLKAMWMSEADNTFLKCMDLFDISNLRIFTSVKMLL